MTESRDLQISIDGSGIEPTVTTFMCPMSYSFEVTLYEPRIAAPIRKRPRRVRRKIEARDGALHVDPARRRKPGSRGRALIRALQMLYGDLK